MGRAGREEADATREKEKSMKKIDSLLIYAYGGPESMAEVPEFLANVAQGKRISPERLAEVLGHYGHFNGKSPMNDAIRNFMLRWREAVPEIPVYFGCRYAVAAPLKETARQMILDGRKRALVFIPAPFNGYRETYFERLAEVREQLAAEMASVAEPENGIESERGAKSENGAEAERCDERGMESDCDAASGSRAESPLKKSSGKTLMNPSKKPRFPSGAVMPEFEFFPAFSENPYFLRAQENVIVAALNRLPETRRRSAVLLFSVHSLPLAVARRSGYESDARGAVEFFRRRFPENQTVLAWQSASASRVPWLEPDVLESLDEIGRETASRRDSGTENVELKNEALKNKELENSERRNAEPGNSGQKHVESENTELENVASEKTRGAGETHEGNEARPVLLIPLGFPFSNMEVAYDLGVEARRRAEERGLLPILAPTIEKEKEFLTMIFKKIEENAGFFDASDSKNGSLFQRNSIKSAKKL